MVEFYVSNNYKEGQITDFKIDLCGECQVSALLIYYYSSI